MKFELKILGPMNFPVKGKFIAWTRGLSTQLRDYLFPVLSLSILRPIQGFKLCLHKFSLSN